MLAHVGNGTVDLANAQLTRLAPLLCLPPDSPPILPDPLPSHLESSTHQEDSPSLHASVPEENDGKPDLLATFDASFLDEKQRERFLRHMRAVEAVRNGATVREAAAAAGMGRSSLGRLLQRTVDRHPRGVETHAVQIEDAIDLDAAAAKLFVPAPIQRLFGDRHLPNARCRWSWYRPDRLWLGADLR